MPSWGFRRESTHTASGANTVAGKTAGYQPYFNAQVLESKRNVIATNKGWVRRQNKLDVHGNRRVIDEVLVAANPGGGLDYTSNTHLGLPDVAQMYVKPNANGVISANVSANLYVVFNTPMVHAVSGNTIQILLANTGPTGNHGRAAFSNTATARVTNANNTLVFVMAPLQGGLAGSGVASVTYQVNAQSMVSEGGGNPLYNPDIGVVNVANLVITGAVSNTLSTFTVSNAGL